MLKNEGNGIWMYNFTINVIQQFGYDWFIAKLYFLILSLVLMKRVGYHQNFFTLFEFNIWTDM